MIPATLTTEVSGHLVGSAAFNAVETGDPRLAGSIPVHLRHLTKWFAPKKGTLVTDWSHRSELSAGAAATQQCPLPELERRRRVETTVPVNAEIVAVRLGRLGGYEVVVVWGEFDPDFGAKPLLVAITQDGVALGDAGPRLVVPGDTRAGRYVSDIVTIRLAPTH